MYMYGLIYSGRSQRAIALHRSLYIRGVFAGVFAGMSV